MSRTNPVATKFEIIAALAERAEQLANGAPSTVQMATSDPIKLAYAEFNEHKLPIKIVRTHTDGYKETFTMNELTRLCQRKF